jgi:hypothetical protein
MNEKLDLAVKAPVNRKVVVALAASIVAVSAVAIVHKLRTNRTEIALETN